MPINVFSFSLKCDNRSLKYNDNFTCRLYSDENQVYDSVKGQIFNPVYVTCNIGSIPSSMSYIENVDKTSFYIEGQTSDKLLLTLNCKVTAKSIEDKQEYIQIPSIAYTLQDGTEMTSDQITSNAITVLRDSSITTTTTSRVTYRTPTTTTTSTTIPKINYLTSLYCKDFSLNFSKYIMNYNVEVLNSVENLEIIAKTLEPNVNVEILGNKNLQVGNNVVRINVGDLGNITTYTINVKRLEPNKEVYIKESDATLFNLNVVGYNIAFKSNVFEYTLPVNTNVERVVVEADLNNKDATYNIKYPEKLENNSKIIITVISEDKTKQNQYIITINKQSKTKSYVYIYIIIIVVVLIIILILLLRINKRNIEKDKILGLKSKRRKLNMGKSFNIDNVPNVEK